MMYTFKSHSLINIFKTQRMGWLLLVFPLYQLSPTAMKLLIHSQNMEYSQSFFWLISLCSHISKFNFLRKYNHSFKIVFTKKVTSIFSEYVMEESLLYFSGFCLAFECQHYVLYVAFPCSMNEMSFSDTICEYLKQSIIVIVYTCILLCYCYLSWKPVESAKLQRLTVEKTCISLLSVLGSDPARFEQPQSHAL